MKKFVALSAFVFFLPFLAMTQSTKRTIKPADLFKLDGVGDSQVSPDGKWVAYSVTTIDSKKDSRGSDAWMIMWDTRLNDTVVQVIRC